ncbi:hypothetical protein ACFLVG_04600 [Chloroflexota bacterium]
MSDDRNWKEVFSSIETGIRTAEKDYKNAAYIPLCFGPEYLISVRIFDSLLSLTTEDSLTLEMRKEQIDEYCRKKVKPGRPKTWLEWEPGSRIDICLWHKGSDRPRAIIEVKRNAENWQGLNNDIKRIVSVLNTNYHHKLTLGVLATCIFKKSEQEVKETEIKLRERIENYIHENDKKNHTTFLIKRSQTCKSDYRYGGTGDIYFWKPVVIEIRRVNRK